MEGLKATNRQMKLFHLDSPLLSRFGSDFFRAIPARPGVYFFLGSQGELLYIGQSGDLKARLGSYRHVTPEKNARRTLKLIHRTVKIEWRVCTTPAKAVELEAMLLLEYRPPFNRAGVWQGEPWWLGMEVREGMLCLELTRGQTGIGPLPSGFRYAFGSLVRCVYRCLHPHLPVSAYPLGLFRDKVPLQMDLLLPPLEIETTAAMIRAYAEGETLGLLSRVEPLSAASSLLEQTYWQDEIEGLKRFAKKLRRLPGA